MQTRLIALIITRIGRVVRRLPKALLRAIGAAVAEFSATLTRPENPVEGSAEDLAQFGLRQEWLRDALQMFMDDRAVRSRKLRQRFGSAVGTNLLSFCEIKGFIAKPEGKGWTLDLDLVRDYQARDR